VHLLVDDVLSRGITPHSTSTWAHTSDPVFQCMRTPEAAAGLDASPGVSSAPSTQASAVSRSPLEEEKPWAAGNEASAASIGYKRADSIRHESGTAADGGASALTRVLLLQHLRRPLGGIFGNSSRGVGEVCGEGATHDGHVEPANRASCAWELHAACLVELLSLTREEEPTQRTDEQRAEQLRREGQEASRRGDASNARLCFEASFLSWPRAEVLISCANMLLEENRVHEARAVYGSFLRLPAAPTDSDTEAVALQPDEQLEIARRKLLECDERLEELGTDLGQGGEPSIRIRGASMARGLMERVHSLEAAHKQFYAAAAAAAFETAAAMEMAEAVETELAVADQMGTEDAAAVGSAAVYEESPPPPQEQEEEAAATTPEARPAVTDFGIAGEAMLSLPRVVAASAATAAADELHGEQLAAAMAAAQEANEAAERATAMARVYEAQRDAQAQRAEAAEARAVSAEAAAMVAYASTSTAARSSEFDACLVSAQALGVEIATLERESREADAAEAFECARAQRLLAEAEEEAIELSRALAISRNAQLQAKRTAEEAHASSVEAREAAAEATQSVAAAEWKAALAEMERDAASSSAADLAMASSAAAEARQQELGEQVLALLDEVSVALQPLSGAAEKLALNAETEMLLAQQWRSRRRELQAKLTRQETEVEQLKRMLAMSQVNSS
jgi:hypothetical protein